MQRAARREAEHSWWPGRLRRLLRPVAVAVEVRAVDVAAGRVLPAAGAVVAVARGGGAAAPAGEPQ